MRGAYHHQLHVIIKLPIRQLISINQIRQFHQNPHPNLFQKGNPIEHQEPDADSHAAGLRLDEKLLETIFFVVDGHSDGKRDDGVNSIYLILEGQNGILISHRYIIRFSPKIT